MPRVVTNQISSHDLQRLAATPGKHHDGGGLHLQVESISSAFWVFRYSLHGRRREMSLGSVRVIGLSAARKLAAKLRADIAEGVDPLNVRRQKRDREKADAAGRKRLGTYTDEFIARNRSQWRNEVHLRQWTSSLKAYAGPLLKMGIGEITSEDVANALRPKWQSRYETSSRVLQRLRRVFDEIVAAKLRDDNPCAPAALAPLLPNVRREVQHFKALPVDAAPEFMRRLREREGIDARALEFLVLTACRLNEVAGAKIDEIDEIEKLWRIPGSRTKSGKPHVVPLTDRAMQIIKQVPREHGNRHLFANPTKRGKHVRPRSLYEVNHAITTAMGSPATVHGHRACFRSWAEERAGASHVVAELALGHVQSDSLLRAYQRSDLMKQRRALAKKWAQFVSITERGKVVPMGRRA